VTLEDIRAHRVVARGYWRRADLSRIGIEREAASVDNMEAQAILILSGAYLGYLPEHYAAGWQAHGLVRSLLPEELAYEALFVLITRRGSAPVAVVRQFVDDLMQSLASSPARGKQAKEPARKRRHEADHRSPRGSAAKSPALERQP
jgi:DNA-binding transcriptional LysR family regulator